MNYLFPRRAVAMLGALVWSSLAFGGEIHDAAQKGDLEKVKALLKGNPGLVFSRDDKHGETPMHMAAWQGHEDVVKLLLASKADVNARDKDGITPLSEAAFHGDKDMVELLLANHADVNAKNNAGETPLHVAVVTGHKDVAEVLRRHGGHE